MATHHVPPIAIKRLNSGYVLITLPPNHYVRKCQPPKVLYLGNIWVVGIAVMDGVGVC